MADLTQGDICEALGVTLDDDNTGGEEREAAEPAPEAENEPEIDGGEKGGEEQEDAEPAPEGEDKVNAAAAAARRRAEAESAERVQKAVDEARKKSEEEHRAAIEDVLAHSGMVDPETGEEIKTLDSYKKMQQRGEKAKNPEAAKAIEEAEAAKSEAEAEKEKYTLLEGNQRLADGLAEIQRYDPDIKSLDDVFASENHEKIYDLVMKGVPLADAYKAANIGKLSEKMTAAAEQRTRNAINSKSHLKGDGASDTKPLADVPRETSEYYRNFFPSMTEEEIKKDYNKRLKG